MSSSQLQEICSISVEEKELLQRVIKEYNNFYILELSNPFKVNKDRFILKDKSPYIFDTLTKKPVTIDNELQLLNELHYSIMCLLKNCISNNLTLHLYNEGTLHEDNFVTYKELYTNLQKEHIELQKRYDKIKKIIIENLTYAK